MLKVSNIHVNVEDKEILKGVTLNVNKGEIHAIMGPNGSGKSTFAQAVMGNEKYRVLSGFLEFGGKNLQDLDVTERAALGIFLAFQYPSEVPGVTVASFLRLVYNNKMKREGKPELSPVTFRKLLKEKMESLKMDEGFMNRYLNEGFSGGEKKRMEILQLLVLEPKLAILDETDSGLDIDALKVVSEGVKLANKEFGTAVIVITHYSRILNYLRPDFVHVFKDGVVIKEGRHELAEELEKTGYGDLAKSEEGV